MGWQLMVALLGLGQRDGEGRTVAIKGQRVVSRPRRVPLPLSFQSLYPDDSHPIVLDSLLINKHKQGR